MQSLASHHKEKMMKRNVEIIIIGIIQYPHIQINAIVINMHKRIKVIISMFKLLVTNLSFQECMTKLHGRVWNLLPMKVNSY